MGPLWLDVAGYELSAEEKEIIAHPTVGGVILFARNYYDNQQLLELNRSIRQAAQRPILIGVDQEGGRVQRFRDGFTRLPSAQSYAQQANGMELASLGGWLMAAELIAHDIDLSFAPVLDCGFDSQAIGSRAFSDHIDQTILYSSAFMQGMKSIGMATTGKHFPGHGAVTADSHLETPTDERATLFELDMAVFRAQIEQNMLDAVMPAHVIYPHYDDQPASGSSFWLKKILRESLGFRGVIFSDDLSMEGAAVMGDVVARAHQSLAAGCDMVLVCNAPEKAIQVIDHLPIISTPIADSMLKKNDFSLKELQSTQQWKTAQAALRPLTDAL